MISFTVYFEGRRCGNGCFVVFILTLLSGCASAVNWEDPSPSASKPNLTIPTVQLPEHGTADQSPGAVSVERIEHRLRVFYESWKGVPYQFGGSTRNGIDCSALTQRAMSAAMNVELDRTTRQQIRQGVTVTADQLQSGDLVFFKTGDTLNHVGVMLGPTQFLHASTRRGVTLSTLEETYWKTRVIGYRRVRP